MATPLAAQNLALGGRVGFGLANFGGDIQDFLDSDSKLGAALGATLGINFSHLFGIQPEVLYVIKGTEDEFMGADIKVTVKYLELQAPLVLRIPTSGAIVPRLYSGPGRADPRRALRPGADRHQRPAGRRHDDQEPDVAAVGRIRLLSGIVGGRHEPPRHELSTKRYTVPLPDRT